jgi:hypothetical protein
MQKQNEKPELPVRSSADHKKAEGGEKKILGIELKAEC